MILSELIFLLIRISLALILTLIFSPIFLKSPGKTISKPLIKILVIFRDEFFSKITPSKIELLSNLPKIFVNSFSKKICDNFPQVTIFPSSRIITLSEI